MLDDLLTCYDMLTGKGFVGKEEDVLVRTWCEDISKVW